MEVVVVGSQLIREWVYSTLKTDPTLSGLVSGRVFLQGSVLSAQQAKPYLVYHFGNQTDEGMYDEDNFQPSRQFLQVFMHVDQGDYGPVDDIADAVKAALLSVAGRPPMLVGMQYLETSQDLQDNLLQTFFRYARFQIAQAK
jgi:hypothetical protein